LATLARSLFRIPVRLWGLYLVVYCTAGGILQALSPHLKIAAFYHDWQVFTLYGLFLVPLSLLLRDRPWHLQYAYAVTAIAPIDVIGFALGTSIAYPGNVIERAFGERSFTLVFVILAGWMPLAGNLLVAKLEGLLFDRKLLRKLSDPLVSSAFRADGLPLASLEARVGDDPTLPTAWQ
jgi:hypothetical protein